MNNSEKVLIDNDILQYILNPYLNFLIDIPKMEKVFPEIKFLQKPHLKIKHKIRKLCYDFMNEKITYLDGKKIECEKTYDNTIAREKIFYQGKYTKIIFYDLNDRKIEESNYLNGKLHGEQYSWYSSGELSYKCNRENGKTIGKEYKWFKDGTVVEDKDLGEYFLKYWNNDN